MKYIISLLSLLSTAASVLNAQSGPHSPAQAVRFVSISSDGSRCLTISYDDAVLWNYQTKTPIWVKKASDFGGFYNLGFPDAVNVDHTLSFMIKQNRTDKPPFRTLFNLNKLDNVGWLWAEYRFASDGRIPAREYGQGKNKNSLYMLDLHTGGKEFITDKLHNVKVSNQGSIVTIQKLDSKDVPKDAAYYDVREKAFVSEKIVHPKTYYNHTLKRNVVPGEENKIEHRFGYREQKSGDKTEPFLTCYEYDKVVAEFPILHRAEPGINQVIAYSEEKQSVSILAFERRPGNLILSFLTTYQFMTGDVLEDFELTDFSEEALASAKVAQEKARAAAAEQDRIDNLPENLLRQRINMLGFKGPYMISLTTYHIYRVRTDKGPYQNNLVSLDAITGTGTFEVFEHIDRLENASLYKGIQNYQTCPTCQGRSVVKRYTEKEIDQSYSAGRKIVETTTITNACTSCGGCGVIPK